MTSDFLECFDRLTQEDYHLLQHLEANGHLKGFTVAEFTEALVLARLALAQEHLDFAMTLDETNPLHRWMPQLVEESRPEQVRASDFSTNSSNCPPLKIWWRGGNRP